jgi:hypothetical protein
MAYGPRGVACSLCLLQERHHATCNVRQLVRTERMPVLPGSSVPTSVGHQRTIARMSPPCSAVSSHEVDGAGEDLVHDSRRE